MNLQAGTKFGGNIAKNEEMNSFDIFVKPCIVVAPGDCQILYKGVMTSTITSSEIASEYFKDYKLELYFLESSHDTGNFEKPMSKNVRKS